MATAREILDERLAKGEITLEQYDSLASRLNSTTSSSEKNTDPISPPVISETTTKGSWLWGIGGIVMALVIYVWAADLAGEIITDCMKKGNTFDFCNEHGVKWPVIYVAYAFAAFVGLAGIANLALPKK